MVSSGKLAFVRKKDGTRKTDAAVPTNLDIPIFFQSLISSFTSHLDRPYDKRKENVKQYNNFHK